MKKKLNKKSKLSTNTYNTHKKKRFLKSLRKKKEQNTEFNTGKWTLSEQQE